MTPPPPEQTAASAAMPPLLDFLLTRKLPCSCLAFTLFTAIFWLPGLFPGAPMIAFLFTLIAVVAHFTTPALFALIQIGGGGSFVTPVALISSAGVAALNRFDPTVTLIYLLFYAVLPAMAANILRRHGGLARSGEVLAVAIFCAVTAALALGAALHGDGSLQKYTRMLMAPMFAPIEGRGGDAVEEVEASLALAMPGLVAGGLWSIWWGGLLGARWLAMRYGFYHDSCFSWYYVRFQPRLALLMLLALVPANMSGGNLQFVAIALSLLLAALFAVQGVAVAHLWLKERQLNVLLAGMYIFLFFWSLAIIPFVVIGLLDTWFDFRRGAPPEEGV